MISSNLQCVRPFFNYLFQRYHVLADHVKNGRSLEAAERGSEQSRLRMKLILSMSKPLESGANVPPSWICLTLGQGSGFDYNLYLI